MLVRNNVYTTAGKLQGSRRIPDHRRSQKVTGLVWLKRTPRSRGYPLRDATASSECIALMLMHHSVAVISHRAFAFRRKTKRENRRDKLGKVEGLQLQPCFYVGSTCVHCSLLMMFEVHSQASLCTMPRAASIEGLAYK